MREVSPSEKRTLAVLGLPTAALALGITVVTTYVPVVAQDFLKSAAVIGALIAIEGILALWLPLVVGSWSDRLRSPIGGRLPFLIAATPVAALTLALMGLVHSLLLLAIIVTIFFAAYFVAYEPYRALYPDLVDNDIAARAQSTQAVWRGAGTGIALVTGGMLITIGDWVPFVAAALLFLICMGVFLAIALPRARAANHSRRRHADSETALDEAQGLGQILRASPALREFLVCNALWEASLGALKTFVFLYVAEGLGQSEVATSAIIGGVAVLILPAAIVSGKLADTYGRVRVMSIVLPFYGIGMFVPAFTTSIAALIPVMILMGFGGGLVMTLPYALMQPLMPAGQHGLLTGFYSLSRGLGTALGPLLAGVAIQVLHGPFSGTDGYGAMWLVCGGTILASVPFLSMLRRRAGHIIDPEG
jgi:MFS family permease